MEWRPSMLGVAAYWPKEYSSPINCAHPCRTSVSPTLHSERTPARSTPLVPKRAVAMGRNQRPHRAMCTGSSASRPSPPALRPTARARANCAGNSRACAPPARSTLRRPRTRRTIRRAPLAKFTLPLITCVPRKRALWRRASGASAGTMPGLFSTGKLSPVRAASSTNRSCAASNG